MIETRSSLILRIRDPGDSASWREFVAIYEPLVRSLARQRGVDVCDLDDVVQQVFLRVVKAAPTFQLDRRRGHFGSWLWELVHHAAGDYFRSRQRIRREKAQWQRQIEALESASAGPPDETWLKSLRLQVFRRALQRVQETSQAATWACFEEQLLKRRPAGEVAQELGLSRTAVYANASRTLARVRQQCADYMEELGDE
jgi:RNA polymerase sigma factor (sigma-70 family)